MHKLPSLISALIVPFLGLFLLFCFAGRPLVGPDAVPPAEADALRQPRPAADNRTSLILLHSQYGYYERCRRRLPLARTAYEAAHRRAITREAIRSYNQVADDADPSAFALTSLPRHLAHD